MKDSVVVMRVKNGYIVTPDKGPAVHFNNSEIVVFESFNGMVCHLEALFDRDNFFDRPTHHDSTVEAGGFETA